MKKFYKILLSVLATGIMLGLVGSILGSMSTSDESSTIFAAGVLLVVFSIIGIRVYYIRSDPVRYAKFKRKQESKKLREKEKRMIYEDEKEREHARLDARYERRGRW